jgi:DNA-binding NtrC family response regulator
VLNGLPILIVEDDNRIARTLADAVEELEGRPIGPVPTVSEALVLLQTETIAAAIVDGILADSIVTPLALALIKKQIPFVVYTGTGLPIDLAELHPELLVIRKPAPPAKVVETLLLLALPDPEPTPGKANTGSASSD